MQFGSTTTNLSEHLIFQLQPTTILFNLCHSIKAGTSYEIYISSVELTFFKLHKIRPQQPRN